MTQRDRDRRLTKCMSHCVEPDRRFVPECVERGIIGGWPVWVHRATNRLWWPAEEYLGTTQGAWTSVEWFESLQNKDAA